jgi:hypothetical protein
LSELIFWNAGFAQRIDSPVAWQGIRMPPSLHGTLAQTDLPASLLQPGPIANSIVNQRQND